MLTILKFSHHFALESPHENYRTAIENYTRNNLIDIKYTKLWNGTVIRKLDKIYAVKTKHPLIYRFHINCLQEFMDWMRMHGCNKFDVIEEEMYEPESCDFKIVTNKTPREMQSDIINYLAAEGNKKVIELQAGGGKTLCTLFAVNEIKQRTVLCIKPMYIQRWMDDLAGKDGIFKLKSHELCKVQGSAGLASIIRMGLDNTLTYKFIIISNKTLHLYFKEYINGVNMEKYHNVKPFELFKVLKAGLRIIDEAHQDFHQCFKTDLFTHIPKTIELSATLVPTDPFKKKMYEIIYPTELRFGGGVYKKYVNAISVPYRLDKSNTRLITTTQRGMTSYNQGAYEESIMRDKKRLSNYLDMVENLTKTYWGECRVSDYKLLIFANRVDMCRLIVERLKQRYPNLKITKYTEEEKYEILPGMDIIVSTPTSAGTAVDIPRLQVCINTVALGDKQANLQMIGRLRELRDSDVKPTFVYLYNVDVSKHVQYHVMKRDFIFEGKVLSYTDLMPIQFTV